MLFFVKKIYFYIILCYNKYCYRIGDYMIRKYKNFIYVFAIIAFTAMSIGVTYSYFNYTKTGGKHGLHNHSGRWKGHQAGISYKE